MYLKDVIVNRILGVFFGILLLPLGILTACLIKISEPKNKIFYNCVRYGKDQKPFKMYKFRTMSSGDRIRDPLNPMLKQDNDNRVTKVGKFIRKVSWDEIPQLLNVIKGDMFIIGPRPCEQEEIQFLPPERFTVMPGISGVVERYKKEQPTMQEICEQEKYFVEHYGFRVKWKAFKDGLKLLCHNK